MSQTTKDTKNNTKRKALAVASFGGHLVQLQRVVAPLRDKFEIVYATTDPKAKKESDESTFYFVKDFSRTNPLQLFRSIINFKKIISKEKPDVVVSTGAAPGLAAIMVAKLMGIRTLWIDSLANVEHLSMCGRVASKVATETLTQWPHLAIGNIQHSGNVL